ncbi:pseudouridine synthase [Leptolyngbya sp. AN02str]|uniref:pseudouridine synthase n=1 Tax=Leptolyngbya sp. AN02str TaxID=3423363 RepID=UPI003D31F13B
MDERLQKILAGWGVASRRQAEQMIVQGRVMVNGAIAQLGQKANPQCDRILVDGKLIQPGDRPNDIYLLLHKPKGVVSTCHDPQGRPTVLTYLPNDLQHDTGIHPVGRLDTASTGALLLTNDGAVTFCLTHPSHAVPKTYEVWIEGKPTPATLNHWRTGVLLEGRRTQPAEVRILQTTRTKTLLDIVLREGRNRQIRKTADLLGHPVIALHRVAVGPILLGSLPVGQYRYLTQKEIGFLKTQAVGFSQGLNHG